MQTLQLCTMLGKNLQRNYFGQCVGRVELTINFDELKCTIKHCLSDIMISTINVLYPNIHHIV